MKRIIIPVIAVPIVIGLALLGFRGLRQARQATPGRAQTAVVRRGALVATVNTAGTVQGASTVDLAFQASGQVKEVKVQEGDAVQAGQVIASLGATEAELQVTQAEASLTIAQAKLEQLKLGATPEETGAAQAALASAEENLRALQAGPSARDIEIARLQYEQAKDQLWSAQCQRDALGGNPTASSASKDQAKASVASAEMSVEIARLKYEQAQESAGSKELRAAESQVAQARANLAKLTAGPSSQDVLVAEAQVKQADVSLQQAKLKLAQYTLTAPFDGTLMSLSLEVGQMVGPSAQVATIARPDGLEVAASMSEVDVARVQAGQEVDVTIDALPERTFKGRVARVALAGTVTQGVVNYPVTIRLDSTDPAIKPGMTANAAIVVDRRENVLLVPSRAIRTQGGQRMVRVLYEGQTIDVPVQLGLSGDAGTEILGDTLKEGDVVELSVPGSLPQRMPGIPGGGMMIGR